MDDAEKLSLEAIGRFVAASEGIRFYLALAKRLSSRAVLMRKGSEDDEGNAKEVHA
jgi:hypothetical protein